MPSAKQGEGEDKGLFRRGYYRCAAVSMSARGGRDSRGFSAETQLVTAEGWPSEPDCQHRSGDAASQGRWERQWTLPELLPLPAALFTRHTFPEITAARSGTVLADGVTSWTRGGLTLSGLPPSGSSWAHWREKTSTSAEGLRHGVVGQNVWWGWSGLGSQQRRGEEAGVTMKILRG